LRVISAVVVSGVCTIVFPGTRRKRQGKETVVDDLLLLYRRASDWTGEKVAGAVNDLDAGTPCDEWNVRALLNHMLDTQRYFAGTARGEDVSLPSPNPPDLIGDDPRADFEQARHDVLEAFERPGVIEKTGPALGIAFGDQLLHGWDVARATNQDATMPDGLAEAAYGMIHGRFSDEQRRGLFKPAIDVPDDASPQAKLLAYTGRPPST
jgi:uncharacterized protein (TIGR03086 family)